MSTEKNGMKLKFTHQEHQALAVQAVANVFDGQPLEKSDFSLAGTASSVNYAPNGSIGNRLLLNEEQLLENIRKVQKANGVALSERLMASTADKGGEVFCSYNFSIEMETGTGKTYTFIKTMYELNKLYGFRKFVIVVPSVAIREGTMKNLEVTKEHFAADYANTPFVSILYDSKRLDELKHFAQSDALSVLVINIDSFAKDSKEDGGKKKGKINRINRKGERAFAPIEYIKSVNPIVIVDEPQNFETDIRRKALGKLNPLCTLRYSATHKNPYNLLYSLNPVKAYDAGLVKQIEVDGVLADENQNEAFIELVSIEQKPRGMKAKVRIDVDGKNGIKRKDVTIKVGDDLYDKSKKLAVYQDGYVLNEFLSDSEIEFSSGKVLRVGENQGELSDAVMRYQIERTVAAHFTKLKKLQPLGIKVLSLFFIDKVANYRSFDEDGNPIAGKFAQWFEEIFTAYSSKPRFRGLINYSVNEVHNGYFSGDKKGRGAKAKTVWVDSTERGAKRDDDTYALIMKDKERLLSMEEPLQFIFSHSALREGWDNPNVFQICTLNETQSTLKKRQEIGRGLRLAVNQQGERVHSKEINILTVVPNESYEAFASSLQKEIEGETGVSFEKRIKQRGKKSVVSKRKLNDEEQKLFNSIWEKINYQTSYHVKLDSKELIKESINLLSDKKQYPAIKAPKVRSAKALVQMTIEGIEGVQNAIGESDFKWQAKSIPDVYHYLQSRLHLSRSTLFSILDGSGRLEEILINPQAFLDMCVSAISSSLKALLVAGIEYKKINGTHYAMQLFDEPYETYQDNLYPPVEELATPLNKTVLEAQPLNNDMLPMGETYACVPSESDPERQFAKDCALDERVKFFFKLPKLFKIATPLGGYNPDWAVVFENDSKIYFVAETKSDLREHKRRPDENLKIKCGEKHFALVKNEGVEYKVATKLAELL